MVRENMYTAEEVAEITRYSVQSIYTFFKAGKLRGIQQKPRCRVFFPESAVEEFLNQGTRLERG